MDTHLGRVNHLFARLMKTVVGPEAVLWRSSKAAGGLVAIHLRQDGGIQSVQGWSGFQGA